MFLRLTNSEGHAVLVNSAAVQDFRIIYTPGGVCRTEIHYQHAVYRVQETLPAIEQMLKG